MPSTITLCNPLEMTLITRITVAAGRNYWVGSCMRVIYVSYNLIQRF